MEIIETAIVDQASHRSWELRGEGGESIKVTLTLRLAETADEFTARAKAILVQAATFHEASSLGLADRPQPERFALEYLDKGEVRVIPGVELPNLEAVRDEVWRSAEDLWTDALSSQEAPTGWAVRARDESGIIASVDYDEIKASMQDTDTVQPGGRTSMEDDKRKKDNRDRSQVAGDEEYEIGYVASKFGLSTEQVRALIAEFGNDRDIIEREAEKLKRR